MWLRVWECEFRKFPLVYPDESNDSSKFLTLTYFTSIIGRKGQEDIYEWEACREEHKLTPEKVQEGINKLLIMQDLERQIFFSIAFPHITGIFGFYTPEVYGARETNLHRLGLYNTPDLVGIDEFSSLESQLHEGSAIIGCPLEVLIFSEEMKHWSESETIEEFFERERNLSLRIAVSNSNKISNQ